MSETQIAHLIGGERIKAPGVMELCNPSDLDDVVGLVPEADNALVGEAITSARRAQPLWASATSLMRAQLLSAIGDAIAARGEDLARILSREEGKLLADARAEASKAAQVFRYYAGLAFRLDGQFGSRLGTDADVIVTRDPHGVVALVTPWNAPLAITAWKLAPALLAGNAVVLKPSERAPFCIDAMTGLIAQAMVSSGAPAGLVNVVQGGASTGGALCAHPDINAISFTGGTTTGRALAVDAARSHRPIQLELGGKNPFVVAADADLDKAARLIVSGAFGGAGQKCTATSRIIVEDAIADAFVDRLSQAVSALTTGKALDETVDLGPVISGSSRERIEAATTQAEQDGAVRCATGQVRADTKGHFLPAVLLDATTMHMDINRVEHFGPVAAIQRVADLDAAIEAANATPFGLSSGIVTRSLATARQFRRESRAGIVAINQTTSGSDVHAPFEGAGHSGAGGSEQGEDAMRFYSRTKAAYIANG